MFWIKYALVIFVDFYCMFFRASPCQEENSDHTFGCRLQFMQVLYEPQGPSKFFALEDAFFWHLEFFFTVLCERNSNHPFLSWLFIFSFDIDFLDIHCLRQKSFKCHIESIRTNKLVLRSLDPFQILIVHSEFRIFQDYEMFVANYNSSLQQF